MLKTTVNNGSEKFRLEKEITETSRVNTDVGTLLVSILLLDGEDLVTVEIVSNANGLLGIGLSSRDSRLGNGDIFAVRIVEEFFTFVGHCVNELERGF
jgi:hypothetical protein